MDRQAFIGELVKRHKARRPLMSPGRRAVLWYAFSILLCLLFARGVQPFRSGFLPQLMGHPLTAVEVLSALLLIPLIAHILYAQTVPGVRLPREIVVIGRVLASLLVTSLGLSLMARTALTPEVIHSGHRPACWLEVLIYGGIVMLFLFVMLWKGLLRFSCRRGVLIGVAAGLLPAVIMQMACMYGPAHAILFHYAPVLLLALVSLLLLRLLTPVGKTN